MMLRGFLGIGLDLRSATRNHSLKASGRQTRTCGFVALSHLIPASGAPAAPAQGKKRLFVGRILSILTSDDTSLVECRHRGACSMKIILLSIFFSIFSANVLAAEQVIIRLEGELFTPTQAQCLDALNKGALVPYRDSTTWAIYRGNKFLISVGLNLITCRAWKM